MIRFGSCFLLLMSASAWAAPEGQVSISIDPDKTYWVGQRVLVHLDLKTDGFSFSDQRFSLPQISGGVLMQTDSSTLKLTEQVEGESWQVLRYDLSLFSQRSGDIQIPPFEVHFNASLGYGQPEASFDLKTQALSLVLKLPPGADPSQPVVTTSRLEVLEQWQPDQNEFKVGEALTRTITLEAKDVSGMALPAGPHNEIEGIDQLAKAPQVEDSSNRGTLSGHRHEQVSYLFKQEGDYVLPAGSINWWNPQTKKLEQYQFEGRSINVKADPLAKSNNEGAGRIIEKRRLAQFLLLFLLLLSISGALLYWQWPRIRAKREAEYLAEPAQFKRAIRACRKNDAGAAWSTSNTWFTTTGLSILAQDKAVWQELQRAMLSKSDKWSGQALKNSLVTMRKNARSEASKVVYLKPLNP